MGHHVCTAQGKPHMGWLSKLSSPFWTPSIIRHPICWVPKKGNHNFDNHPHVEHAFLKLRVLNPDSALVTSARTPALEIYLQGVSRE